MATFTTVSRGKVSFEAPRVDNLARYLDIGSGYNLLIDDTNKLIINPERGDTPWSTITREKVSF